MNFEKILNFLGYEKEKIGWKPYCLFFLMVLIPQILRQAVYLITFSKTGSVEFIASIETIAIFSSGMFFIGVIEEIIIGLVFITVWFKFRNLRLFVYGWLFDALFDFISVGFWYFLGATPLQGLGQPLRFIFREIVFSYVLVGPVLWKLKVNVKYLSYLVTLVGVLLMLTIYL